MHKYILIAALLFGPCLGRLSAQALGEDAGLQYYWGKSIQNNRLYADNGLGKTLLLQNTPSNWLSSYSQEHFGWQSDAIFGQMLVSTPYPNKFRFETQSSHLGEVDASLFGRLNFKKVETQLQANGNYFGNARDKNQDLFLDLPLKRRLLLSNVWEASVPNYQSSNRIQYLRLSEEAGQLAYFGDSAQSTAYHTDLLMSHFNLQSQHLIAVHKSDLLLIDLQLKDHQQTRNWGLRNYQGREWLVGTKANYEYHLDNQIDIFRFGLEYRQHRFDEELDSIKFNRDELMGAGFVGYDTYWGKKIQISSQLQISYHNLAGIKLNPLLKVNYNPLKFLAVNAFGGSGWRYANPLTENSQYLFSNRSVQLPQQLAPEEAWIYGLAANVGHWVRITNNTPFTQFFASLNTRFYQQIYTQQVVADLDANAYALSFYNLNKGDRAQRTVLELDAQITWNKPSITLNVDYRFDNAKTTINGIYRALPFYSKHNWMVNLQYYCRIKVPKKGQLQLFQLQTTWFRQSPQRIPNLDSKTNGTNYPSLSGVIKRWDFRFDLPLYDWIKSNSRWKYLILNFGVDNVSNQRQPLEYIGAQTPFNSNFDGGMTWNSYTGKRVYFGLKYLIQ